MTKQSKTGWQKFLYYVWLPFSIFMTAMDLIQIGDNFWPTLIHWADFLQFWIDEIRSLRDLLFSPFEWLNVKIPLGVKDYILVGILLLNSILSGSVIYIKKQNDKTSWGAIKSLFYQKNGRFKSDEALNYFAVIFLWPIVLGGVINHYFTNSPAQSEKEVMVLAAKTLMRVIIVASILILVNYFLIAAKNGWL